MPSDSTDGDILTLKQVADFLKVTERTIYRLAAAKKIPAFKVGGTWRFLRGDIDQWIKKQTAECTQENESANHDGMSTKELGECLG